MKKHKQKKNRIKRRFTIPFTWLGLVWGIASFIFLITETGKEGPTNWLMYYIFFPAYLNARLFRLLIILGIAGSSFLISHEELAFFIDYFPSILFGLLIGFIIGITVDGLIAIFKPMENDDG